MGSTDEVAHLRLRYKKPGTNDSLLIETPIAASRLQSSPSEALRLAAAVSGFADILRGGTNTDGWGWDGVLAAVRASGDPRAAPARGDFLELVELARGIIEPTATDNGLGSTSP